MFAAAVRYLKNNRKHFNRPGILTLVANHQLALLLAYSHLMPAVYRFL